LEVGVEVGIGFPLLKLDDQRAQLALQAAQAAWKSAQATAEWRRAEQLVAEQELQNAEESEPVARREADRQKNLAEAGSGADSAADQAHLAWLAASGRLDRARATVASVEAAWQAAMIQAEAAEVGVRQAELELEKCELTAPFIGEVVSVATEVGSWMSPGVPVCELIDRRTMLVQAPLPNADVDGWRPEYSAWFSLPAYMDQDGQPLKVKTEFHGLAPVARVESRARQLQLKFDNQQLDLPGGAFAEVWIDLGERSAIWLQPSDFRFGDHGPEAVVVVNDHADVRALRLGRILIDADGQSWHPVLEGLSAGEIIAVDNLETPRTGDPVLVLQ
jgi:multidrug efflux pump subunit AcrA (membrane-fusion protein)